MGRSSAAMEAYRGVPSVIGSPSLCAACKSAASVPVAPDSQAKLFFGTQVVKVVSMMQPWSQPSLSVRTMYPVVGSSCRGELGEARPAGGLKHSPGGCGPRRILCSEDCRTRWRYSPVTVSSSRRLRIHCLRTAGGGLGLQAGEQPNLRHTGPQSRPPC